MDGRIPNTIVVVSVLILPVLIWLAIEAKTNTDDLNNWIDKSSTEYAAYLQYTQRFGSDDEFIVSWDGCTTDDPRLATVASDIRRELGSNVDQVVTGAEAMRQLGASASRFSENASRRRLRGSLFGDDLETTCVIVRLNESGRSDLRRNLQRVESAMILAGIDPEEVHLGGKAISDFSLNSQTNQSLWWGIPGTFLAAFIALVCIRNIPLTIGMVFVSMLAGLASLAVVPLFGVQVNGLLVLMPVLVFVLTLGCAVHMVRGLQGNLTQYASQTEAVKLTLQQSRPPVILSMLTTAIGIGSLCLSPLPAVFQFGLFSAGSLVIALLLLMFLLPAIWQVTGFDRLASARYSPDRLAVPLVQLNRHTIPVLGMFLLLALPAIAGIPRFETDLNTHKLFANTTRFAKDYSWIEENLYPLGRVDFVVSFPQSHARNRFRQLRHMQRIQTALRQDKFYHSALSAANFIRVPKSNSPFQRELIERIIATQIDHDYDQLHSEGMLHSDETHDRWRITVACPISEQFDQRAHADRMLSVAISSLDENIDQIEIRSTGLGPLSASGQRRLFRDLARGLITALIVITPLIMLALRSTGLGLLAMIPNLFPILIVFGYCGLLGRRLDVGTILTASVGLGIAIDDTVHFFHYYKLGHRQLDSADSALANRVQATRFAIRRCANPIITTTLIVCFGLFLFSFSQFLPVRNFAICLILLMAVAAIADLILLPALLVGPIREAAIQKPAS